jgi:putative FmdB family regulatory protein
MPIYEYVCSQCGRQEERLESLSAPSGHDCPGCGAALGMARALSVPALAFPAGPSQGCAPSAPACAGGGGCPYGH